MNPDQPVHAVEAKRLRDLVERVENLGNDSGILADLLSTKAYAARHGDDLSDCLYFAARYLERIRDTLSDIEGEMNDLARPDIDIAEIVRWVKGPAS